MGMNLLFLEVQMTLSQKITKISGGRKYEKLEH
jgi:hypothetical protein